MTIIIKYKLTQLSQHHLHHGPDQPFQLRLASAQCQGPVDAGSHSSSYTISSCRAHSNITGFHHSKIKQS